MCSLLKNKYDSWTQMDHLWKTNPQTYKFSTMTRAGMIGPDSPVGSKGGFSQPWEGLASRPHSAVSPLRPRDCLHCWGGEGGKVGGRGHQSSASFRGSLHSTITWEIKACPQGTNSRQLLLASALSVGSVEASTEAYCRSAFLSAQSYFPPVPFTSVNQPQGHLFIYPLNTNLHLRCCFPGDPLAKQTILQQN